LDALTFIVEILKATAWPLAALLIALVFRTELRKLLGRIRKGKVGPAEFEFEETVRVLSTEAKGLNLPPPAAPLALPKGVAHSAEPRATILQAWVEVEDALNHLAYAKAPDAQALPGSTYAAIRQLANSGVIGPEYIALLNDLRSLRNQAVHELEFKPSSESVLGYVKLASDLIGVLQRSAEAA
jgi:hypothetical protein